MTARDWQPGEVAIIGWTRTRGQERAFLVGETWVTETGCDVDISDVTSVRPLAVIDPEAPIPDEWVALAAGWMRAHEGCAMVREKCARDMLAALFAHIATPRESKPVEPTGDRATVRDRDGVLWTRMPAFGGDSSPWLCGVSYRNWDDLDVPADGVLFGGVE